MQPEPEREDDNARCSLNGLAFACFTTDQWVDLPPIDALFLFLSALPLRYSNITALREGRKVSVRASESLKRVTPPTTSVSRSLTCAKTSEFGHTNPPPRSA